MQSALINIEEELSGLKLMENSFSFKAFIDFLKHRIETERTIKSEFYRFILNKFQSHPELYHVLDPSDASSYKDILELVYTVLSPGIVDERSFFWAISTPVPSTIVYGTDAFYGFLAGQHSENKHVIQDSSHILKERQENFVYRLILERLYKFPSDLNHDYIYSYKEPDSKLVKYLKIHTDTTFIEVSAVGTLPDLSVEVVEPSMYEGQGMNVLKQIMPLDMFKLSGFSVITLEDVTADHAIENIRLALVNHNTGQNELYHKVIKSLQTLSGSPAIKFGLLPFLQVNNKLVLNTQECGNSKVVKIASGNCLEEDVMREFIEGMIAHPVAMFFNTISDKKIEQYPFLEAIRNCGVKSYGVLPVFYNRRIAGIMEIYSEQKVIFYERLLSHLRRAIPLLAQLLENSAEQFRLRIEEVIKTNFTTLQPSVEWKFHEASWQYLNSKTSGNNKTDDIGVSFSNVYPLYGAIDIRDSTIKHNLAMQQDIGALLELLTATLDELSKHVPASEHRRLMVKSRAWIKYLRQYEKANDEVSLKNFLHSTISPYLYELKVDYPETENILAKYSSKINEGTGEVYTHRRAIDVSVKQINNALTDYFDRAQPDLQSIYPFYFEKFRSDGIEYDIYTGQSLAPDIEFTSDHLKKFRLWQVRSMMEISKLTHALLPKMSVRLQTASLIFVHSSRIDISFRNDERRFDVEGYYNIRYEVIKKRIDKVTVKKTGERLTQPDKLSLVYFNEEEIADYLEYIRQFQQEKLLNKEIEFLELEELQGVSGLKAIRVGIKITK